MSSIKLTKFAISGEPSRDGDTLARQIREVVDESAQSWEVGIGSVTVDLNGLPASALVTTLFRGVIRLLRDNGLTDDHIWHIGWEYDDRERVDSVLNAIAPRFPSAGPVGESVPLTNEPRAKSSSGGAVSAPTPPTPA